MESCGYISQGGRCGSRFNCKEVEFRHPEYKALSQVLFICQSHFIEVFGQSVAVKDSKKPLEEEAWLLVQLKNEDSRYRRKLGETKKLVKNGIGNEHFDWATFEATNKRKVEDLKSQLKIMRRKQCRFEWCKKIITNWRQIYTIRVYPRTQMDYVNLNFCCLDHWEVFKKRIGLKGIKGSLDETKKRPTTTLDNFKPERVIQKI